LRQISDQLSDKRKQKQEKEKIFANKNVELDQLTVVVKDRQSIENNLEIVKSQFEKRRAYYQVLASRDSWIEQQLDDFINKKHIMHEQHSPACPLCEQVLTMKRKQFLGAKFAKQEKLFEHKKYRVSTIKEKLKQLLIEQREQLRQVTKQRETIFQGAVKADEIASGCKQLNTEIVILTDEIKRAEHEREKLEQQLHKQKTLLQKIQQGADVLTDKKLKKLKSQSDALQVELKKLAYDKTKHDNVQQELHRIEQKIQQAGAAQEQRAAQSQRREQISHIIAELRKLKQLIAMQEKKLIGFVKIPEQLKKLEGEQQKVQTELDVCNKNKEQILQQIGQLENEKNRLAKVALEVKNRKKQMSECEYEIDSYQTLAQAFSKNGIQALLIEEAIPEIEEQANALLARLTDNQAQIFIESLRDLKKGGVRETLDIQIADSAGIRPYEMYSGGEAFRIDFALRIAISKLLARRAGTSLQLLIIDEGFGSQDEEGLQRLMDAIYAVKDDFTKVIVVSHLPALKDNFPVHFVVTKRPNGSQVCIEERG
jgi:exonuclease SbcC